MAERQTTALMQRQRQACLDRRTKVVAARTGADAVEAEALASQTVCSESAMEVLRARRIEAEAGKERLRLSPVAGPLAVAAAAASPEARTRAPMVRTSAAAASVLDFVPVRVLAPLVALRVAPEFDASIEWAPTADRR